MNRSSNHRDRKTPVAGGKRFTPRMGVCSARLAGHTDRMMGVLMNFFTRSSSPIAATYGPSRTLPPVLRPPPSQEECPLRGGFGCRTPSGSTGMVCCLERGGWRWGIWIFALRGRPRGERVFRGGGRGFEGWCGGWEGGGGGFSRGRV